MLIYYVLLPIIVAVLLYVIPLIKSGRLLALLSQAIFFVAVVYLFIQSKTTEIVTNIGNFENGLGIILKMDVTSSVFVLLTTFIFLVVTIYNYQNKVDKLFWFLIFIWQGLLLGIFFTCDIFNMFVLMEVATVIVTVLIMYKKENRSMYDGLFYLMVNTVAMQFYLFGLGYLYKLTGVFDLKQITIALSNIDKSSVVLPFALIMTAICLKCALVPFFGWLPKSHGAKSAPCSVPAISSAIQIKSAIYMFIRFKDVFAGVFVSELFIILAALTAIIGFMLALMQTDIMLILAYSTISQVGLIMLGLNSANSYSYLGSIYHIVNHALIKSTLFLCAGIISEIYKTRDLRKIKGVFRRLPVVAVVTLIAVLGITGAPLLNGSISKYLIMADSNLLMTAVLTFINFGTIVCFIRFSAMLFGKDENEETTIKIDTSKLLAICILAITCIMTGLFYKPIVEFLFSVSFEVDIFSYLQKTIIFVISAFVGYLIYKFHLKDNTYYQSLKDKQLSFRKICASIGFFFALVLLISHFF